MDEDEFSDIWDEYVAQVRPLKNRSKHIFIKNEKITIAPSSYISLPTGNYTALMQFDKSTFDKIKKGKIQIDAKMDLHGYFLDEAYNLLAAFIKNHYILEHKLLLVITGKSKPVENQPTIRSSMKDWIENSELLNIVHSISNAADIHGGSGAVYLKLRRKA